MRFDEDYYKHKIELDYQSIGDEALRRAFTERALAEIERIAETVNNPDKRAFISRISCSQVFGDELIALWSDHDIYGGIDDPFADLFSRYELRCRKTPYGYDCKVTVVRSEVSEFGDSRNEVNNVCFRVVNEKDFKDLDLTIPIETQTSVFDWESNPMFVGIADRLSDKIMSLDHTNEMNVYVNFNEDRVVFEYPTKKAYNPEGGQPIEIDGFIAFRIITEEEMKGKMLTKEQVIEHLKELDRKVKSGEIDLIEWAEEQLKGL
ncbi:hypothetical protein DRP04_00100 [Archaeoglobales archaeon]|jgi:hypothetical protein|nr:MAG: hypothetical protein DRP04_00100 [Archaeoglobales archaeon]HDN74169.1 hypothetical protein [Archaeoglobus sp.]